MDERRRLAEAVRDTCVQRAIGAYQDAGMQGLCAEGRWEVAIDAVRHLDLSEMLGAHAAEKS